MYFDFPPLHDAHLVEKSERSYILLTNRADEDRIDYVYSINLPQQTVTAYVPDAGIDETLHLAAQLSLGDAVLQLGVAAHWECYPMRVVPLDPADFVVLGRALLSVKER